jgi:hypothetical protein
MDKTKHMVQGDAGVDPDSNKQYFSSERKIDSYRSVRLCLPGHLYLRVSAPSTP